MGMEYVHCLSDVQTDMLVIPSLGTSTDYLTQWFLDAEKR